MSLVKPRPTGRAAYRKLRTRSFWHLTARGADPTLLPLPRGWDPATMLERQGPEALTGEVARRVPLADAIVDQQLLTHLGWSETATRLTLVRETSRIIAARPPAAWLPAIARVTDRLRLSPGVLHLEVVDQSQERPATSPGTASRGSPRSRTVAAGNRRPGVSNDSVATDLAATAQPLRPNTSQPPGRLPSGTVDQGWRGQRTVVGDGWAGEFQRSRNLWNRAPLV